MQKDVSRRWAEITELVPETEVLDGREMVAGWQGKLDLDWCVVNFSFEYPFGAVVEGAGVELMAIAGDGELGEEGSIVQCGVFVAEEVYICGEHDGAVILTGEVRRVCDRCCVARYVDVSRCLYIGFYVFWTVVEAVGETTGRASWNW